MIVRGCYCDRLTRTLVHVFINHADTCTCEQRRIERTRVLG